MTPQELFDALVAVARVLQGECAVAYVTPRQVAAHCGWTSESMAAAMRLAGLTWDQVIQVALGYPRRVVARVAGRQGLYDTPALEHEPGSDLARRIAQMLRPALCAPQPTLLTKIQAGEVQVPSVEEQPHTPRPLPSRGSKVKARGFKETLTHSLLETREQRQEMAEEVQALLEEEARGPVKKSTKKPTKKVNQKRLTADQRFRLMLQEHQERLAQGTFLSLDVETTDNSTEHGRVIELGLTAFMGWREVKRWCWRFDPQGRRIGKRAFEVHGIRDAELQGQPLFAGKAQLIHQLMHRAGVVVAHNLPYDKRMLSAELERAGLGWPEGVLEICTAQASKAAEPGRKSHKLDSMCAQFQIQLTNHHAAEDDARACGLLWRHLYTTLTGLEVDAPAREEVA